MTGSLHFLWPALMAAEAGRVASGIAETLASLGSPPAGPREAPRWATRNRVVLELTTLRLRDFSTASGPRPTLICSPFALHGATVADFAPGHSVVKALRQAGVGSLFLAEWRSATPEMRFLTIDAMLADLNLAVDELGGRVNLVGLCQGGWLALVYTARFPEKVEKLVMVGAPVDTAAETAGPTFRPARMLPPEVLRDLVALGGGRVMGQHMLQVWNPAPLSLETIRGILQCDEDVSPALEARFRRWHDWTVDLPGTYYLQVFRWLYQENRLAKGGFFALGRRIDLSAVNQPVFLLAGSRDQVVPKEQVLAATHLIGTNPGDVHQLVVDAPHLGLFMGRKVLSEAWPQVALWLGSNRAAPRVPRGSAGTSPPGE